jgi:hypothetical protein
MAVAEYAPGSEVIADGKVYKSRYIRKLPTNANNGWESGYFCTCQNCREPNFTKDILPAAGRECVSCRKRIPRIFWMQTLEPRMGFLAESGEGKEVPMHRPEREYKSDDYYIGDPSRNIIETTEFEVNGQAVKIESTSNDSLVVVVREPEYNVCPVCGYASDSPLPQKHKNAYGYECKNREGTALKRILSHDFKTDVAKIEFDTPRAADFTTMVSVLYAILEGMSSALGIERTDIKGTLHKVNCNNRLIYSIILYDAVAGGAGHVRRIVTKDGQAFQSVLNSAYRLVTGCDCDKSCYKCLRNYYNQKLHDELDRGLAAEFIAAWIGPMTHKERENAGAQTHEPMRSDAAIPRENVKNATVDYDPAEQTSWDETLKFLKADITESEKDWLHALRDLAVEKKIVPPYLSAMITPEQDDGLWPDLTWPEHRIAVFCEAKKESYDKLRRCNWAVYRMTDESVSPPALLKILQAKEE